MHVSDTLRLSGSLKVRCPRCGKAWRLTVEDAKPSEAIQGLAYQMAGLDIHTCRVFAVLDGGESGSSDES